MHLERNLARFGCQKGSKKPPKSEPKWSQNGIEKRSKNKIDFWSLLRRASTGERSNNQAGRSRGGGRGRHKSLPLGTWTRIWFGFVALVTIYTPWGLASSVASADFGFPRFLGCPGGFRKVREAERKNSHQFSSKTLRRIPSYDQQKQKIHDY